MIFPSDLYITQQEFDAIIKEAEANFMHQRNSYKPEERKKYVQFWVKLCPSQVSSLYIEDLKCSYENAGWKIVDVEFTDDNTHLMVYLNNLDSPFNEE